MIILLYCQLFLQEGASEELVSVLLGNKSDLPEEDGSKVVKMKDGIRLADVSYDKSVNFTALSCYLPSSQINCSSFISFAYKSAKFMQN